VPREAQLERETGMAAVRGDDDGRSPLDVAGVLSRRYDASNRPRPARAVHHWPDHADALFRSMNERAGSRIDANFAGSVIATLAAFGIEVLDQRPFFGDALAAAGSLTRRVPSEAELADVRRGFEVARSVADARVGQTVVVRHGVVTAVEAVEGTSEAIRRGAAHAGPGAVVVKVAARDQDYRFDVPAAGMETLEAARDGGVTVLAVESERVAVLDRAAVAEAADAAGIAVIAVSAP